MNDKWMATLTDKLKSVFGDRLLFVGLQGSYQRGESNENSDIDAVVILNTLSLSDLKKYKNILYTMSESEKTCGFISGKQELENWPKHEIFQFSHDTKSYYGNLKKLLPQIERQNVIESVKIGVSGIYHSSCHSYLHGENQTLRDLYKSAFFILQAVYYLRNGEYIASKKELQRLLNGIEKNILTYSINCDKYKNEIIANSDEFYDIIIRWCSNILNENFVGNFTSS